MDDKSLKKKNILLTWINTITVYCWLALKLPTRQMYNNCNKLTCYIRLSTLLIITNFCKFSCWKCPLKHHFCQFSSGNMNIIKLDNLTEQVVFRIANKPQIQNTTSLFHLASTYYGKESPVLRTVTAHVDLFLFLILSSLI